MSRPLYVPELPLSLAVLPLTVEEQLRMAGVPVEHFRMSDSIAEDVQSTAGRFVIYDSKNPASKAEAKTARFYGLTVVDIADLLMKPETISRNNSSQTLSDSIDAEFMGRLKKRIEKLGGLWIRLADFPFPYHSAVCRGDIPDDGRVSRLAHMLSQLPTSSSDLTWQTDYNEFVKWWEIRKKVVFGVQKQEACYRIQCDSIFQNFRPALELWKGSHVASFALEQGEMMVPEDGLVLHQQQRKHLAGLSILWTKITQNDHSLNRHKIKTA